MSNLAEITKDQIGSEKLLVTFPQLKSIREQEVLYHIVNFKTNRQTADIMCISVKTVKFHKTNLFKKIGLYSVGEVLSFYWHKSTEKKIVESIKSTGVALPYNPEVNL